MTRICIGPTAVGHLHGDGASWHPSPAPSSSSWRPPSCPVAADGPTAYADWGAPTAVAAANTVAHDGCPIESPNGKQLFVASTRTGGFGKNDIWVAERQNKHAPWGPMTNLGAAINSADHEFCPTPLGGGWLLFVSDRAACGATPGMTPPVGDMYLTRQRH